MPVEESIVLHAVEQLYKIGKHGFQAGIKTLVDIPVEVCEFNDTFDIRKHQILICTPNTGHPVLGGIFMKYSYEYKKHCVELYREGKWPETPEGVSPDRFHHAVVEWNRLEKTCGLEALQHKNQNKVWTAEEKYELVAKVLAGASKMETAISEGISTGLLYQWVRCYKMKGYQGLASQRKGRPPKEPDMKKKVAPAERTPSEREEMILLRAENERLRAEIAVVKKRLP